MALGKAQVALWEVACPRPPSGPTLPSHTPLHSALSASHEHPAGGTAKVQAQQWGFGVGGGVQGGSQLTSPEGRGRVQQSPHQAGRAERTRWAAGGALLRGGALQEAGREGAFAATQQVILPGTDVYCGPSASGSPGSGGEGATAHSLQPPGPGRQVGGPPSPPQEAWGPLAQAAGAEAAHTGPRPTANAGNWRQDFLCTWNPAAHDNPGASHGASVQRVGAHSACRTLTEGPAPSAQAASPAAALPQSLQRPLAAGHLAAHTHLSLETQLAMEPRQAGPFPEGPRTPLTPPACKGPHTRTHSK